MLIELTFSIHNRHILKCRYRTNELSKYVMSTYVAYRGFLTYPLHYDVQLSIRIISLPRPFAFAECFDHECSQIGVSSSDKCISGRVHGTRHKFDDLVASSTTFSNSHTMKGFVRAFDQYVDVHKFSYFVFAYLLQAGSAEKIWPIG